MTRANKILAVTLLGAFALVGAQIWLGRATGSEASSKARQGLATAVSAATPPPAPSSSAPAPAASYDPCESPHGCLKGEWLEGAEFTTWFKADPYEKYKGRVHNIEKLADILRDTTIQPGEEWSFNKATGPRTEKEGYLPAPTYFLGEIRPGIGGGSCQVSSTMYAAAMHAGMKIVDRRPHSRPSTYIKPGLDATVNYPPDCWDAKRPDKRICFDLVIKNPYDFPIMFHFEYGALVKDGKRSLLVKLHGTGKVPKVTSEWKAYGAPGFKTRHHRVSYWPNSRIKLKQQGKPGLTGARFWSLEYPDGRKETNKVYSRYRPVPHVLMVGMEYEIPEDDPEKDKTDT